MSLIKSKLFIILGHKRKERGESSRKVTNPFSQVDGLLLLFECSYKFMNSLAENLFVTFKCS